MGRQMRAIRCSCAAMHRKHMHEDVRTLCQDSLVGGWGEERGCSSSDARKQAIPLSKKVCHEQATTITQPMTQARTRNASGCSGSLTNKSKPRLQNLCQQTTCLVDGCLRNTNVFVMVCSALKQAILAKKTNTQSNG